LFVQQLERICCALYGDALAHRQETAARTEALRVISGLFRSRWEIIRPVATSLVCLPKQRQGHLSEGEEDLTEAEGLLLGEHNKLTPHQSILNLCSMLKLESTQVAACISLITLLLLTRFGS
jgi:hypothetical protein